LIVSAEAWMAVAITALYLYDCVILLHWNEALLASPWKGKWIPLFGSRTFTLRGKELSIASALLPGAPVFRLHWSPDSVGMKESGFDGRAVPLRRIQWFSLVVFVCTILLLPAALLSRAGDAVLLVILATVYASVLGTLVCVWLKRRDLQLTGKAFASLAFEVLACPPFAPNVARKLSMNVPVREDFVAAARRLLDDRPVSDSFGRIKARLRDEMDAEEPGSERLSRLRSREAQLQ
jgi:hypothetical protein